jgi:hypothetical protein
MTTLTRYISRIFLIVVCVCAVSIGTAGAQPPGRLVISRSPNFGWNIGFNLQIDGTPVTTLVQSHHYQGWVPAGRHVLTVTKVPYTGYSGPTSTIVDVQPGWTYAFTAMWDSSFVFLRPSGAWLTPGELWQNGWPSSGRVLSTLPPGQAY